MLNKRSLTLALLAAAILALGGNAPASEPEALELRLPAAMGSTGTVTLPFAIIGDLTDPADEDQLVHFRRRFYSRSYYYPRYSTRSYYYPRYSYSYGYYPRYRSSYAYYYPRTSFYYPRSSFGFSFNYYPRSYYYGLSYYPCADTGSSIVILPGQPSVVVPGQTAPIMPKAPDAGQQTKPMQPVPPGSDGTFPYDGGPSSQPPSPASPPNVTPLPRVPLEGRAVSLITPEPEPQLRYPAYGEQPVKTSFAKDRTIQFGNGTIRMNGR